ncbi:MFS transporter (macronuclear) [Tetrahymena thermophila SB210]|uniref:MFS transporter n=1 Tax=Tetrahymena thermophila (strain SB210) TaxID=312017 RepID=I7M8H6_TETTS|nr:MFS transporter [Tetrahymena thermophila SB210]EAR98193.2 MFS transporter [Tetrahymena thermophila SB210]|eukprot:XP_001018438.2 MFS transporter [Tetrahymena thermophila SB210]
MIINNGQQNQEAQSTRMSYLYLKLLLLVLSIGINSTVYSSIPFIFYQSQLECLDRKTGKTYKCSYQEACDLESYKISSEQMYPQIYSITQYLGLFCDRSILEVYILTSGTLGRLFANIFLVLIPIKKEQKEIIMDIFIFITGLSLCLLQFISSLEMFIISFFIWYFCFSCVYVLVFIFIEEFLPNNNQNKAIALTNIAWPVCTVVYVTFAYYYGHWKNTLVHFVGIPCILISISNFILAFFSPAQQNQQSQLENQQGQIDDEQQMDQDGNILVESEVTPLKGQQSKSIEIYTKEENEKFNDQQQSNIAPQQDVNKPIKETDNCLYKYFPFMFHKVTRNNFYIWTFCCVSIGINYASCYYFLNQIQGDIYVNSLFSTLFEVFASLIATFLVVTFPNNLKIISTLVFLFTGLAFVSLIFFYEPKSNLDQNYSYFQLFIVLFPIIIAKISFDIGWIVLISYLKKVIPISFQQQQFSTSNQLHALAVSFMPSYRYLCIRYDLNPFVGLGVISLLASISTLFFIELSENDCNQHNQKETQQKTNQEKNIES